ncbi:MAG: hypothetical protein ABI792_07445 [bacterium]
MRRIIFVVYFLFMISILLQNLYSQNCLNTSTGLPPIIDLGTGYFRNFQGGLYPGGSNSRPLSHNNDGINLANQIVPLDTAGNYNPVTGKIVLLSVGMSNCSSEFLQFIQQVSTAPNINPKLVLVNGAQGGQAIDNILDSNALFWTIIIQRLASAGVSAKQVQAVWFKEAQANPTDTTFPNYPAGLKDKFKTVMNILNAKYKNLKQCYSATRIYAGYATSTLNPEPYSYYTGWSVKWMIEDQINGDSSLNYKGTNIKSPWLSWGPYLWADGIIPNIDGLTWVCPADFNPDGTHPSAAGRIKVASRLLDFFSTDETAKPWFIKSVTLNLKLAVQGFLNVSTDVMNMRDTVRVYLRNNFSPFAIADSSAAVIDSITFRGVYKFYNAPQGTYYIQTKHRNSIETWSRSGGEPVTPGSTYEYDFTNSISNAFGNNLILVGTKYCIFSGDVNQDGIVNLPDVLMAHNDAAGFVTGYTSTDVTGNRTTDLADVILISNNAVNFVIKITP